MSDYDPFDQVSLRGYMNLTPTGSMNPRLERRLCGLTLAEREGRIKMYAARYADGRDIFTGVKLSGVESLEDLFMFDADDDPDGDLDEFDEDDEFDDDDDEFDDDDDDDDDADDDDLDSGWGE